MEASDAVLRDIIDRFVQPEHAERFLYLLEKPKRRSQLYEELLHDASSLRRDKRQALEPPQSDPDQLLALLRKKGAGQTCFIFSRRHALDGQQVDFRTALASVAGQMSEAILYCPKAHVAFVEEHDGRQFILSAKL
ncbi:hypothetical protein ASD15_22490 [Massilia sp. Root351]|jgi:hypothetical protein|uniref:hypothetical protein n=1 Tax=Massilia sp. Root351 TaxID=1736522 RepID=UPI00070E85CE|nr:hypothetical protein [Massilia sp. Root351]KQV78574.1 hypothetical protein ASD15_22490 [Massilia sp. Root351]